MSRRLLSRTRVVDDDHALLARLPARHATAWVQGGDGLVGIGRARRVDAGTGPDRFARAAAGFDELLTRCDVDDPVAVPGTGPVAFASFTFAAEAAGSVLVVPEVVVGRRGGTTWVTRTGPPADVDAAFAADPLPAATAPRHHPEADHPRHAGASVPDVRWLEAVATTVARIEAGGLDKAVLARDVAVWAEAPFDVRVLAGRLAARFPGCFTFLVDDLVGATPELLVERQGRRVQALPLAGTARRGEDQDEDERLGAALLASPKDRHEHAVLVDALVATLEHRLTAVSRGEPHLLRLDNVQHLATRVVGELADDDASVLDLVADLHPTPAVGGSPTAAALELIDELEGLDRGRYAGPVGWTDRHGDGQFGIALRCAEVTGARARLFAGAGIVAGSLPEAELEETRVKLRAMRSAFSAPEA
jgi:menaquinone-specific isochorismate synthase